MGHVFIVEERTRSPSAELGISCDIAHVASGEQSAIDWIEGFGVENSEPNSWFALYRLTLDEPCSFRSGTGYDIRFFDRNGVELEDQPLTEVRHEI